MIMPGLTGLKAIGINRKTAQYPRLVKHTAFASTVGHSRLLRRR